MKPNFRFLDVFTRLDCFIYKGGHEIFLEIKQSSLVKKNEPDRTKFRSVLHTERSVFRRLLYSQRPKTERSVWHTEHNFCSVCLFFLVQLLD